MSKTKVLITTKNVKVHFFRKLKKNIGSLIRILIIWNLMKYPNGFLEVSLKLPKLSFGG